MSLTPQLPLSRTRINRDAVSRKIPGFLDQVMAEEGRTRVVLIWRGEALLAEDTTTRIQLVAPSEIPEGSLLIYLGITTESVRDIPHGTRIVAAVLDDDSGPKVCADMTRWVSARTMAHALDDLDTGIVVEALAMANWHYAHTFSPTTGAPAESDQAGWTRVDQSTGKDLFPRTDAAVIALVTDQHDRIVLGSNALWEASRYSLLAGFVEPGESLEAAVIREVFEESGLVVTNPVYMGSQPWPFPASLMVGFAAEIDESSLADIRPDGTEIIDLRWFSREELLDSLGEVLLPGRPSIARAMIENWLGQELPEGA
ncbi:MAG: NAD(+) diphosphatase [Pontimonas sp.]|nr:NAD(+) diphosphatase [Pontimonas sp.]